MVVGLQLLHNKIDRAFVIIFCAAPEGVGQQLLTEGLDKSLFLNQRPFKVFRAANLDTTNEFARWIDGKIAVRVAPTANRIVILQSEANGVHLGMATRTIRVIAVHL